jgi:hypothetical protein
VRCASAASRRATASNGLGSRSSDERESGPEVTLARRLAVPLPGHRGPERARRRRPAATTTSSIAISRTFGRRDSRSLASPPPMPRPVRPRRTTAFTSLCPTPRRPGEHYCPLPIARAAAQVEAESRLRGGPAWNRRVGLLRPLVGGLHQRLHSPAGGVVPADRRALDRQRRAAVLQDVVHDRPCETPLRPCRGLRR